MSLFSFCGGGAGGDDVLENLETKEEEVEQFDSKKEFDCIVIGSGIGGLTTASSLTDRGKSVLLVDSRDIGGLTASFFLNDSNGRVPAFDGYRLLRGNQWTAACGKLAPFGKEYEKVAPGVVIKSLNSNIAESKHIHDRVFIGGSDHGKWDQYDMKHGILRYLGGLLKDFHEVIFHGMIKNFVDHLITKILDVFRAAFDQFLNLCSDVKHDVKDKIHEINIWMKRLREDIDRLNFDHEAEKKKKWCFGSSGGEGGVISAVTGVIHEAKRLFDVMKDQIEGVIEILENAAATVIKDIQILFEGGKFPTLGKVFDVITLALQELPTTWEMIEFFLPYCKDEKKGLLYNDKIDQLRVALTYTTFPAGRGPQDFPTWLFMPMWFFINQQGDFYFNGRRFANEVRRKIESHKGSFVLDHKRVTKITGEKVGKKFVANGVKIEIQGKEEEIRAKTVVTACGLRETFREGGLIDLSSQTIPKEIAQPIIEEMKSIGYYYPNKIVHNPVANKKLSFPYFSVWLLVNKPMRELGLDQSNYHVFPKSRIEDSVPGYLQQKVDKLDFLKFPIPRMEVFCTSCRDFEYETKSVVQILFIVNQGWFKFENMRDTWYRNKHPEEFVGYGRVKSLFATEAVKTLFSIPYFAGLAKEFDNSDLSKIMYPENKTSVPAIIAGTPYTIQDYTGHPSCVYPQNCGEKIVHGNVYSHYINGIENVFNVGSDIAGVGVHTVMNDVIGSVMTLKAGVIDDIVADIENDNDSDEKKKEEEEVEGEGERST